MRVYKEGKKLALQNNVTFGTITFEKITGLTLHLAPRNTIILHKSHSTLYAVVHKSISPQKELWLKVYLLV